MAALERETFRGSNISFLLKQAFFCLLLFSTLMFVNPKVANAKLQITTSEDGTQHPRSLESLRDLDYQTWQVVVYPGEMKDQKSILRIVGYPGTLRFDHPTVLKVHAGRKDWSLEDITLLNKELSNDPREAAAEFDLSPLLVDLTNNRPLRLMLPGVFTELPIPPYLVSEWRTFLTDEPS